MTKCKNAKIRDSVDQGLSIFFKCAGENSETNQAAGIDFSNGKNQQKFINVIGIHVC